MEIISEYPCSSLLLMVDSIDWSRCCSFSEHATLYMHIHVHVQECKVALAYMPKASKFHSGQADAGKVLALTASK